MRDGVWQVQWFVCHTPHVDLLYQLLRNGLAGNNYPNFLKQIVVANRNIWVGPHYPVKREGGLEQTRVYGHAVVYANTDRADGRVEAILPELGVFGKRPKSTGQYHHS